MKTTEELINDIKNCSDIYEYLEQNESELKELSLPEFLNDMLERYHTTRSKVLSRAQMTGNNYGYEIFNNKKVPSRDKIISICCGFPLTLEETQTALICGRAGTLYPRDKRDAIIMLAIQNKYTVTQLNDILFEQGMQTLE